MAAPTNPRFARTQHARGPTTRNADPPMTIPPVRGNQDEALDLMRNLPRRPFLSLTFVMKESLPKLVQFFYSTHEDNTAFSFEIGKGSVISAWDTALRTMKVGEVAKITCKLEYAHGSAGSPPDTPPDAVLIFEVELVACKPRKGSSISAVTEERARLAELKKQRELAAAAKEEEKKKREEAKALTAARIQAKMDAKKNQGEGKGKAK